MSFAEITTKAKEEVLNVDVLGKEWYNRFVENHLETTSKIMSWDALKLAKLKIMSRWIKRQNVWGGDNVIKLPEESQLLARFFVIQQS